MNEEDMNINTFAKVIWDYTKMGEQLTPADAIIAMGSMDMRVAERAADLWHQKLAPVVVVTGGIGRLTGDNTATSEAAKFAEVLRTKGLPEAAILIENKASNGAENFTFSIDMLHAQDNPAGKIIAVTQPYMERRAYATAKKLFPDLSVQMASPEVVYDDYPTADVPKALMINIIVGELYRIETYPEKGFTISQDIPLEVKEAEQLLVERGYTEQLPKKQKWLPGA